MSGSRMKYVGDEEGEVGGEEAGGAVGNGGAAFLDIVIEEGEVIETTEEVLAE
jgi:hypothetical protein